MTKDNSWIAIIDDDPSVLGALTRSLRLRAMEPKTFQSAQAFLSTLGERGLPWCLILDLQMPGMTGLELLLHLGRIGIRIPTIVITAHGDADTRERCEAAGAVAVLSKPWRKSSLFEAIDAASKAA